jgi:hypothetical protein
VALVFAICLPTGAQRGFLLRHARTPVEAVQPLAMGEKLVRLG